MFNNYFNFVALPLVVLFVVVVVIKFPLNKNIENAESLSHRVLADLTSKGPINFELNDLEGRLVSIGSFSDQVVILNLWATWCGPCVEEFPALIELARKVPALVLIAVTADRDLDSVNAFLKAFGKMPANIHILTDPNQMVGRLYGTVVLPESYIFVPQKHLIRKVVGSEKWDRPDVIEFFRQIVADAAKAGHQSQGKSP